MRKIITVALILVLAALVWQFYDLYLQHRELKKEFLAIDSKWENLKKDGIELQADLQYFMEPENIEKELRSRFNYKKPGEKLIIVVPPKSE